MPDRKAMLVPTLLVAVGVGWLLTTLGIAPDINWIWTIGLAVLGILTFVVSGVDKVTIVIGSLLIIASLLSVLRQTGRLSIDHEMPILVILTGILLFIARTKYVALPSWLHELPNEKSK